MDITALLEAAPWNNREVPSDLTHMLILHKDVGVITGQSHNWVEANKQS